MQLWKFDTDGATWAPSEIPGGGLALRSGADGVLVLDASVGAGTADVVPFLEHGVARAALVSAAGAARVLLNGYPPLGAAVLEDRDEILIDGVRLYFAAATRTEVHPFAASGAASECVRCHLRLQPGDAVVACPGCDALHHEGPRAAADDAEMRCRSYDPACARCGRSDAALLFDPGEADDA